MSENPSPRPQPEPANRFAQPADPTCDVTSDEAAAQLVAILDEYLANLKAGQTPDRQKLIARYPGYAAQLEACLAGLEFIQGAETNTLGPAQQLGDFRIIREIGRGGMGAVFEAEQISLRRRVALKILRYGAVSDPESVERFKREAETVAKLHHTNIVPIFNVGREQGVNYYAMQLIEGRSLADLLSDPGESPSAAQIAQWGLQAADALAHAHQRGVVHRDVKPSNLLLDGEHRIWLTDFGLARRMDDVTLSITGALLGTPRYMSPEQASAAHKCVDARSDLFSLGATLYELVAGQPAFPGDRPHDVIQHILTCDPIPLRRLNNTVPRDLETIITKCLSKNQDDRYATASELAADFRAFLDGRPIRARRPAWPERTVRWFKRQQHSVKLTATAVTLTMLITFGSMIGWSSYRHWQQAAIQLDATTPPLVVELMDDDDRVLRVETAPMQNPMQVPAGDYRLRMSADGKLSETLGVRLTRGDNSEFKLDLDDQLLWTPRDLERSFDVVDFGDSQGVVLWNQAGIGVQRQYPPLGWTRDLNAGNFSDSDANPGFRWHWSEGLQYSGYGQNDLRPWVSPHAVDIDGRGLGDLIVAGRHQAWLMAIAGEDGRVLWFSGRGHDLALPTPQAGTPFGANIKSAVVGTPVSDHDCNGDGVPDVIATLVDIGSQSTLSGERYVARCWVEAISGQTGASLWSYAIPDAWLALPAGEQVPYDLRWFAGQNGGSFSSGGGSFVLGRHRIRHSGQGYARSGSHAYRLASAALINIHGTACLGIVAGKHVVALDLATGDAFDQPREMSVRPGRTCQWQDTDGDGNSELVMLERVEPTSTVGQFSSATTARLVVWSLTEKRLLWTKALNAGWPIQPAGNIAATEWPLIVDLNGNQQSEIIVPSGSPQNQPASGAGFPDIPWGTIAVFEATTGKPLWSRKLVSIDLQVDHFTPGVDIDGDGYREVFAVTLSGAEFQVHVDALSGRNGQTLWTNRFDVPPDKNSSIEYYLQQPQWWQAGTDGWPQLVCQLTDGAQAGHSFTITFSAGTGAVNQVGRNITSVCPADIDADGVQDLLVYESNVRSSLDLGGRLHCLRGVAREKWARLGDAGEPVSDLDGDGVQDLLAGYPSEKLTATSGATGRILWRSTISEDLRAYEVRDLTQGESGFGDLNGDGTTDLIGWKFVSPNRQRESPLFAISGKTGNRLWTASDVPVQMLSGVFGVEACDLEGDGQLEVLWLAALDYGYPLRNSISSQDSQLWAFVFEGRTGALRWSRPLSAAYGRAPGNALRLSVSQLSISPTFGDIDGDETLDIMLPELLPDGLSLQTVALSGKSGRMLWSRPAPQIAGVQLSLKNWVPPVVCDLNNDNRPEVLVVESSTPLAPTGKPPLSHYQVAALRGGDGSEIWNWIDDSTNPYWQPTADLNKGELMRPRALRANAEQLVGVLLPGQEATIATFNAAGLAQTRQFNLPSSTNGMWAVDADGNGVDDIVYFGDNALTVLPADRLGNALWTQAWNEVAQPQIIAITGNDDGRTPVLAVSRGGSDNSVFGVEADTGRKLWSCAGVILRSDGAYVVPRRLALLATQSATPHVYYSYDSVSRCRQAMPSRVPESSSAIDAAVLNPIHWKHPSAVSTRLHLDRYSAADDPRWSRSLPWIEQRVPTAEIVELIAWSLAFSALLVVLPIACLLRFVRSPRFSLRTMFVLPAVTALFLTAWFVKAPAEAGVGLVPRLGLGVALSPVVITCGLVIQWALTGRWQHLLRWFVLAMLTSGLCAAVLLWLSAQRYAQLPEVHYDLSGWYLIVFVGTYLTSWMLVLSLAGGALKNWLLRRFNAYRTKQPAADKDGHVVPGNLKSAR